MMRWRMNRDGETEVVVPLSIAEEAEQFLAGRYLDMAFNTERDVPAWVWLSALAHGDAADLSLAKSWLSDHEGRRPEFDAWGRILQLLAAQVEETVATARCSLEVLQQDVLLPIELAILSSPVGPATLFRIVNSALAEIAAKSASEGG